MKLLEYVWTVTDGTEDAAVYTLSNKTLLSFPNACYGFPRYAIQVFGLSIKEDAWNDEPEIDLRNCLTFQECDIAGIIKTNAKTIIFDTVTGKVGIAL